MTRTAMISHKTLVEANKIIHKIDAHKAQMARIKSHTQYVQVGVSDYDDEDIVYFTDDEAARMSKYILAGLEAIVNTLIDDLKNIGVIYNAEDAAC